MRLEELRVLEGGPETAELGEDVFPDNLLALREPLHRPGNLLAASNPFQVQVRLLPLHLRTNKFFFSGYFFYVIYYFYVYIYIFAELYIFLNKDSVFLMHFFYVQKNSCLNLVQLNQIFNIFLIN